jgi:hypothetical protein
MVNWVNRVDPATANGERGRMRLALGIALLAATAPSLARAQNAAPAPSVEVLHDDARLRAQFERDRGYVRLLLLLSPT